MYYSKFLRKLSSKQKKPILDELTLINAIRNKDDYAYRLLINDYKNKIYNTSLGIVHITEDAEDITQEVFIEVFRSISQFKGDSKLST